jgi:hypothetical protein
MIKYDELVDENGTIKNKTTGQSYKDPTELASAYGDTADKIDWTKIAKSTGASAGNEAVKATSPVTPTVTPSPVVTSTQARQTEAENAKQYVQYAGSPDVFEKSTGRYVSNAEATANNIWGNIQTSTEARPANITTPTENIQKVFGADWKPSPAITPELQAKGIYGAVKVGNQVYTIGTGGHAVGNEEFKQLFRTDDQTGIVGSIDLKQAVGLGITPTQDDISSFNSKMTEDMYSVNSLGDLATKSEDVTKAAYKKSDEIMTNINTAIQDVIASLKTASADKAKAKAEESKELGLDEKDKSIVKAQTVYSEVKSQYDKYIEKVRTSTMTISQSAGFEAQARANKAIELAPLEAAISIAQGSYDRAKTVLDEWSDDYDENYQHLLSAYQMNIDNLGTNLTYEQGKAKTEAEQKLSLLTQSYTEMKSTQEEVKKISLMYPEAGVSITDSWATAYEKVSPYIANEKDFEKKSNDLDLELKKAQISATGRSNRSSTPTYDSGVEGITTNAQLTRFQSSLGKAVTRLQSGESWGQVWGSVKALFPNVPDDIIDNALGGSVNNGVGSGWAKDGAYQEYKATQQAASGTGFQPVNWGNGQ